MNETRKLLQFLIEKDRRAGFGRPIVDSQIITVKKEIETAEKYVTILTNYSIIVTVMFLVALLFF